MDKFISELHGLRFDDHAIKQPWVTKAQEILAHSNLLNVYGPRRHGKTATAYILARPENNNLPDTGLPLPMLLLEGRSVIYESELASIIADLFWRAVKRDMLVNKSPAEMVAPLIEGLRHYSQTEGVGEDGKFWIVLDEIDILLHNPQFRLFLSAFANAIKDRKDFNLIVLTAWPLAVHDWPDLGCPILPNVRVQKWDRPTSQEYYDCLRRSDLNKKADFDEVYNYVGGCPLLLHRNRDGNDEEVMQRSIDEYMHDIAVGMLAAADECEGLCALEMLKKLSQGEVLTPKDPLSRAAAMHLLTAGVAAETAEGNLISAGRGFDAWITNYLRFGSLESATSFPPEELERGLEHIVLSPIRFQPLIEKPHGLGEELAFKPIARRTATPSDSI